MKEYLLRLISSKDHEHTVDELIATINKTGTDKYDNDRKHIFYDYYGKYKLDFFAEKSVNEDNLEDKISEMVKLFPERTLGDRNVAVKPDIVIIYDASKCDMIKNVYDHGPDSDCFRFTGDPIDALIETRKLA